MLQYPFLVANLLALPFLALAFLVAGRQRFAMIVSGLLFTPWGTFSPLLDDYWSPARLGGYPVGVEDFVISFQTGASIWFWASLPQRRRLGVELRLRPLLVRAFCLAAGFLLGVAALTLAGISAITQVIIIPAAIVGVLLWLRPRLWRLALSASVGYSVSYAILLSALYALLPNLAGEWRAGQPWTIPVLSLPLGEIAWALVGAPAHALCFAFVAQARIADAPITR